MYDRMEYFVPKSIFDLKSSPCAPRFKFPLMVQDEPPACYMPCRPERRNTSPKISKTIHTRASLCSPVGLYTVALSFSNPFPFNSIGGFE